jgi:hypothetical protein
MLKDIFSLIKGSFLRFVRWLVVITFFAAGLTLYFSYREARRKEKPMYIKGIITDRYDRNQRAYFKYKFTVSKEIYINSAYRTLCSECKDISCVIGDSLLIEYRKGNPGNNAPVCNR